MIPLLETTFERYRDRLETRAVLLDTGALERCVPPLRGELGDGRWLIVCDEHTWSAAGERTRAALEAAGQPWTRWDAPDGPHGHPVCDEETVAACREAIRSEGARAVLAIGSGTLNDIGKFGAHKAGVPAGCIATAPSMNGYTSGIAAVLTDGVKTTQACTPTRVIIADTEVMAAAPAELIQSGIGDLASKPVSNADWVISAHLTGSTHSSDAEEVIAASWGLLDGVAPGLKARDPQAVERLSASLILSGFAMTVAGSSAPASGGEHLISHYLDMVAINAGEEHDLHGRQVGVGTLVSALLYERLLALDPTTIDPDARAAALAPPAEHEQLIRERFGTLAEAVLPHARAGYPEPETLRARLAALRKNWSTIMAEARATLRPARDIAGELSQAGAPVSYAEISTDRETALRSIVHSRDIRSRYTILDLVWELGYLDEWAEAALTEMERGF